MDGVFEQGHGYTDELTCLAKAGCKMAVEISAAPTELAGRTCVIVQVRNLSGRRRTDEELR
ncbi:MAG: hypothetical protein ACRDHX_12500, partial [Chloroflexota bacterium]